MRFAPPESLIAPVIVHCFDCDSPTDFAHLKSEGMTYFSVRRPEGNGTLYSDEHGVAIGSVELFCNEQTPEEITNTLKQSIANKKQHINVGSHEQYFYKSYSRYLPDHFQRMETAISILHKNSYQPCYFNELFS